MPAFIARWQRRLVARGAIDRYLRETREPRLNLGCGSNVLPGWLNADAAAASRRVVHLDARRMRFLPAASFVAVFCEHMIEHAPRAEAERVLSEIYRLLRPGGVLRLVTPSLESMAAIALGRAQSTEYVEWFRRASGEPGADAGDAVNAMFYGHGHRYIWSEAKLTACLQALGFREVRRLAPGAHGSEIFRGVDGHGAVIGECANRIEAFALEATRP
jgi:SAM-dependent methyltransferase